MIRKAGLDDIDIIKAMAEIAFRHTYKDILTDDQSDYMMEMMYSYSSLYRQMTVENNVFFIEDGKGYVSYRFDVQTDEGVKVFHLEKLYVLPNFQGEGLGRRLFNKVISEVKLSAKGPCRVELNVNRNNTAISFYERMGMQKASSGDFPIGNGYYMNDYIMVIDL